MNQTLLRPRPYGIQHTSYSYSRIAEAEQFHKKVVDVTVWQLAHRHDKRFYVCQRASLCYQWTPLMWEIIF